MAYTPPKPGEPLEPGWLSQLWAAVLRATRLVAGPGIRITEGPAGRVVSLDGPRELRLEAVVTAAPPHQPADPDEVFYTVRAIGRDFELVGVIPAYGRPTKNNEWKIWPAEVGDRCEIVRVRSGISTTDLLEIKTEAIAARGCP